MEKENLKQKYNKSGNIEEKENPEQKYNQYGNIEKKEKFYLNNLAAIEQNIMSDIDGYINLETAYDIYSSLKNKLDKEKGEEFERIRAALAKVGHKLVNENFKKTKKETLQDKAMLAYYQEHVRHTSLEKSLTLVSLGAVVISLFLGFNGITGNIIAQEHGNLYGLGAIAFVLGLLGLFLSNKK